MTLSLKQARLMRGFTQKEIAKRLGIHVHTYSKMERNPDGVTVGEAKSISSILGIGYDYIFFNNNSTLSRVVDDVPL